MSTDRRIGCGAARLALGPDPEPRPGEPGSEQAYAHYINCEACRRFYQAQRNMSNRLRRLAQAAGSAPPWLAGRIRVALDRESPRPWRLFARVGAVTLAAAAIALFAIVGSPDGTKQLAQPLAREAHIGLARPAAIESADTGVLRAWLEHEVGYAVDIPSISDAEIVGATVAEMGGVRSAAVVYRYHGMPLTYFDIPAGNAFGQRTGGRSLESASASGYEVAVWTRDGGSRAVAAPMPRAEVLKVANECRRKAGDGS